MKCFVERCDAGVAQFARCDDGDGHGAILHQVVRSGARYHDLPELYHALAHTDHDVRFAAPHLARFGRIVQVRHVQRVRALGQVADRKLAARIRHVARQTVVHADVGAHHGLVRVCINHSSAHARLCAQRHHSTQACEEYSHVFFLHM